MAPSSSRIHILKRMLGFGERTSCGIGHSGLDLGKHLLVHRLPVGVGHGPLGLELPEQAHDWVLLLPVLDFLLGAEVGLADALCVRAPTIGLASISVGPSPALARAIARAAACVTAKTSLPSTMIPGMP